MSSAMAQAAAPQARMETIVPDAGTTIAFEAGRMLVNPGSVGQPRDGDPRASGLLLDLGAGRITWLRAGYDIAATQRAMRAAGLPARGVSRLALGI